MSSAAAELPKTYVPMAAEESVTKRWKAANAFHAEPGDGPAFSIVIPPPNVTAALHLGHALNNTLQDVLIRYHRMSGDLTLWMPGTDHAGIATQTVVEKRLLSEGISRLDIGREAFIAKTQEWKEEYEAVILDQLESMGASCDYERTRFTMDEVCATAVRHAFYVLFADGLIYRGKRLVNWDPATRTALSDDEVENEEVDGHMWYLRYPLDDGSGHVTVATTRPETMFGDTAVAVNPDDLRAGELRGKSVRLPIVDRVIPIVEDAYVVMADPDSDDAKAQFATGFLKVTPAHDPNDWEIGLRHDLDVINVMAADASISDKYGWDDASETAQQFIGLSREAARDAVVDWFRANDLLDSVRDYSHSVGHSYRSHVPIEPWLSDQWYVASSDDRLRGSALRAQDTSQIEPLSADFAPGDQLDDGSVRFTPARYAKTFQQWHENIRDWCVSRQLWWGHQIPVWSRTVTEASAELETALSTVDPGAAAPIDNRWTAAGAAATVRRIADDEIVESVCVPPQGTVDRLDRSDTSMSESEIIAALEADGFERDPDVLDTWFSSALWPMSTMGWPYPEDFPAEIPEGTALIDTFNPTSVLSTGREIITLWVSRMVMFNRYFLDGQIPFDDVFIHALVQDGHGQKMSKSLGNGVDPRDIIYRHGADAMRFTLVQMTTDTQDVRMPVDLVCPHHEGEAFTPEFITTKAGHQVAAPNQVCPTDSTKNMVSAYGVAAGVATPTDDAPLARNTSSKFDLGRNFSNKVWNAVRFAVGRLDIVDTERDVIVDVADSGFTDRWILARLHRTIAVLETALEEFQFNVYADTLYDFIWRDVCDRYLEAVKPTLDDTVDQQIILGAVLDAALRLMHPVCPFITEELWPHVSRVRSGSVDGLELPPNELLVTASWPVIDDRLADPDLIEQFDRTFGLVTQIRTLRSSQSVKPKQRIDLHAPQAITDLIGRADGLVETLAGLGSVLRLDDGRPAVASPMAFEGEQIYVSGLAAEVDIDAERARITKTIDEKSSQVENFEKRLANPGYLNNAKPELVAETREMLDVTRADLEAAKAALASLA